MEKSITVIGDVHGCYKSLMALIAQLPKDEKIVFCGDLIDRGPMSSQVVEYVKNNHDCVKGNHEDMMISACIFDGDQLKLDYYHSPWLHNGGFKALQSYDIDIDPVTKKNILNDNKIKEHIEWMKTLPVYIEYKDCKNANGDYLVVSHTGGIGDVWGARNFPAEKDRFEYYVMWERKIPPKRIPNAYNIFGHTPQKKGALVRDTFACVDTGCCFKKFKDLDPNTLAPDKSKPIYGVLTAIQFPSMKLYVQPNIDW